MKLCFTFFLLILCIAWRDGFAQKFNLNFEECNPEATLAQDWIRWGDHDLQLDTVDAYEGTYAASVEGLPGEGSFGSTAYRIPSKYAGSLLTLKGYIKRSEVINETTQSQAEYSTMVLRIGPNATVIGSTTAGADGSVSSIILPGGIRTMISGIGVLYPDGRETHRINIIPNIELRPTVAGIKTGRDELLEKAVEVIMDEHK